MRLSIVTETFPPDVNGVAMTLYRFATGLEKQGHQIQIIRPQTEEQGILQFPNFEDIQVMGLPIPGYPSLRFGLPSPRKIQQLWKENRPDAVYIATEGPLGLSALDTAEKLGIPATSGFHTNFQQYMGHYKLPVLRIAMAGYLKWFHNRTKATFAPSPCMVRRLELLGFENLELLGRGVDTQLFHPSRRCKSLREEWGATPEDPVAIYVGRVAAEKNLGLFIKSVTSMREQHPGLKTVIVGDGPELEALRKELPFAHFAGTKQGEELATYYASADFFLFPSLSETFGNVVTEAMASGLVTLAYDYAAPKLYIQDGFNGFTAKRGNEEQFLAKASEILGARSNWPNLRQSAHESVQHLAWDSILARFEKTHMQVARIQARAA
jgi:glycosyltransferase involved in cell wall biosynthesis